MRNDVIVEKLIAYTDKILSYCNGLDYDSFSTDSKLVEACVFNLSQMGELANRVDEDSLKPIQTCPGVCCMDSAIESFMIMRE